VNKLEQLKERLTKDVQEQDPNAVIEFREVTDPIARLNGRQNFIISIDSTKEGYAQFLMDYDPVNDVSEGFIRLFEV
jgi:hypothetical protein